MTLIMLFTCKVMNGGGEIIGGDPEDCVTKEIAWNVNMVVYLKWVNLHSIVSGDQGCQSGPTTHRSARSVPALLSGMYNIWVLRLEKRSGHKAAELQRSCIHDRV